MAKPDVSEPDVPEPEAVVPAPAVEPVNPAPAVELPALGAVLSVGPVAGSLVLVELLVLEVVGGRVVVVGGRVVVVGAVLVVVCRRALVDDGAEVVEVVARVARVVRGTITVLRGRVVVGALEVAGETCWCGRTVVVVGEVAWASCLGEVARPTMLPPIAPISIAVTTLTHRRPATKATGRKPQTPPFELRQHDDKRESPAVPEDSRDPRGTRGPTTARPPSRHRRAAGGHHGGTDRPEATATEGGAVMGESSGSALDRWREQLEAWAIPDEIIGRAPESPWGFPVGMFRAKADQARRREPTPSNREALRFLGEGRTGGESGTAREAGTAGEDRTVLDVGAGGGAASLPLAGSARRIVAVDESAGMVEAFLDAAAATGVAAAAVRGRWPDVAVLVDPADVVVCNDVLYNVQDLAPFALALTDHARRRVVVQITERHPLVPMGPLWRRFHDLDRPTGPTADDAVAALASLGLQVERYDWTTASAGSFERRDDLVAFIRRRLCLPASRDPEIAEALEPLTVHEAAGYRLGPMDRPVVTLSWAGTAT